MVLGDGVLVCFSHTAVEAQLRRFSTVLDAANHVLEIRRTSCTRPDSKKVCQTVLFHHDSIGSARIFECCRTSRHRLLNRQDRDLVLVSGRRAIAKRKRCTCKTWRHRKHGKTSLKCNGERFACMDIRLRVACLERKRAAPTSSTTSWPSVSRLSFARGHRPWPVSAASRGCACISVPYPHTNADGLCHC